MPHRTERGAASLLHAPPQASVSLGIGASAADSFASSDTPDLFSSVVLPRRVSAVGFCANS